jgi:hypothetical protein
MSKINSSNKVENKHLIIWAVLSILILSFKLMYHELWKDEWQAYFVARDMDLFQMLSFLHYEGHPSLWYFYLKVASLFSSLIEASILIQLSHFLLVAISLYILIVKINLSLLLKCVFALSYFVFFEYGIVNRGYILLVLFSFLITYLIQKEEENSWKFLISIFLLCQVEVYGVLIAFGFLSYLILSEGKLSFSSMINKVKKWNKQLISFIAGVVLLVITIFPRGNEDDFSRAYIGSNISLEGLLNSFQGNLSNVFFPGLIADTSANGYSILGLIFSLISLITLIWLFKDYKKSIISILLFVLGMVVFHFLVFKGGIRQWGIVYIFFICIVSLTFEEEKLSNQKLLFILFLTVGPIFHNIRGLVKDYSLPFTNAKETGLFIKEKVPEKVPVIGINKFETTPVSGYADRPLYEMEKGEAYTYFKWLEKVYIPTEQDFDLFAKFKNVGGVVVLSPKPLSSDRYPKLQLWKAFDQLNFKNENYFLYTYALDK